MRSPCNRPWTRSAMHVWLHWENSGATCELRNSTWRELVSEPATENLRLESLGFGLFATGVLLTIAGIAV